MKTLKTLNKIGMMFLIMASLVACAPPEEVHVHDKEIKQFDVNEFLMVNKNVSVAICLDEEKYNQLTDVEKDYAKRDAGAKIMKNFWVLSFQPRVVEGECTLMDDNKKLRKGISLEFFFGLKYDSAKSMSEKTDEKKSEKKAEDQLSEESKKKIEDVINGSSK